MPLREGVNIDRGGAVPSGVWALFCPEGLRWVKLRHRLMSASRQLYPRKQIFACAAISVAMGQEATSKSRTECGSPAGW